MKKAVAKKKIKRPAHVTRRARHMEKYVTVSRYGGVGGGAPGYPWRVRLKVGAQEFTRDADHETKREALWMRDMLCIALDAIVNDERDSGGISAVKARNLFLGKKS